MQLLGSFSPPGDKSISHRMVLFSLLAKGPGRIRNLADGEDVRSSMRIVQALGGRVAQKSGGVVIRGPENEWPEKAVLDCGNSGTTMRLMMGILAGRHGDYILDGDESLRQRPMERVAGPLRAMGGEVECHDGKPPVWIRGKPLRGIEYALPVASAQLKSAVLLAGIRAQGQTRVLEPAISRDHTERLIRLMGGRIGSIPGGWEVDKSFLRMPPEFTVPGDISSAAFFLAGAAIIPGSRVIAENTLLNPTRAGFVEVMNRMGADLEVIEGSTDPEPVGSLQVNYSPNLRGCRIPAGEIPLLVDEVPILALVATQAQGETVFEGVGELRIKESDRLAAIESQLNLMGAKVVAEPDRLTIHGPTRLTVPERLDSFGDHRMAMTLRIASLLTSTEPKIGEESCAAISYPAFLAELKRLSR